MDVCPDWLARHRGDGALNLWYRHNVPDEHRIGQVITRMMALLVITGLSMDCIRVLNDARQQTHYTNPVCAVCNEPVRTSYGAWAPTLPLPLPPVLP